MDTHARYLTGRLKLEELLTDFSPTRIHSALFDLHVKGSICFLRSTDPHIEVYLQHMRSRPIDNHPKGDQELMVRAIAAYNFAYVLELRRRTFLSERDAFIINISNNLFLQSPELWFSDPLYIANRASYRQIAELRKRRGFPVNMERVELYSAPIAIRASPGYRAALALHWWEELALNDVTVFVIDLSRTSESIRSELSGLDLQLSCLSPSQGRLYKFADAFPVFEKPFGDESRLAVRGYTAVYEDMRRLSCCRKIDVVDLPQIALEWQDPELASAIRSWSELLQNRGLRAFDIILGNYVPEKRQYPSQVEAMDISAERKRDFEAFVVSASAETHTKNFLEWAGGERVTLAIAFTDIVGSTALGGEVGDEQMNEVRNSHFSQGRKLLARYEGREIKTIGDSVMTAFHSVDAALDFAIEFRDNPGHARVQIRVGIHVGPLHVEGDDVFGGTVNFAARVVAAINEPNVWLSDRAKQDLNVLRAQRHDHLEWERLDDVPMKGFPGLFTLWSTKSPT